MPVDLPFSLHAAVGRRFFFSGIGGSGMSALAIYLLEKGAIVVGSDRDHDRGKNAHIFDFLKGKGVHLVPQDGTGIDSSVDLVVFSTAIEKTHPEVLATTKLGIRKLSRAEFLAALINTSNSIAVAGTSGKSTTSGMLAYLMHELGFGPNFIGGARVKPFHTPECLGNMLSGTSNWLVAEACESDGTLVLYKPSITVISNISLDHHTIRKTEDLFRILAENTRNRLIINADDAGLGFLSGWNPFTYGFGAGSELRATDVKAYGLSSSFTVESLSFRLNLPGLHNVQNALACLAVLHEMGISLESVVEPLERFTGIDRRFDIHLNRSGCLVVDDYAHNPEKIAALMRTTATLSPRVTYVFQPHGFGPTRMMKDGYIDVFRRMLRTEDRLLILPIYYAGGSVNQDISSLDLVMPVKEAGKDADLLETRDALFGRLTGWKTVVVFGARDESLSTYAASIARELARGRDQDGSLS